ncbi:hypothetical protein HDU87_004351 [Geranomyces variabilis]|uniref:Erythromycin biosynthesis protein CIII-like C-terminal domain-containing protein n=1 Tax=Geranomyces variabilis TaxID=109894 RepID=A0AAD5XMJ3_9FUNG|nr:hypothetical protein HDU87_004351 [Geranomyces variabilis]
MGRRAKNILVPPFRAIAHATDVVVFLALGSAGDVLPLLRLAWHFAVVFRLPVRFVTHVDLTPLCQSQRIKLSTSGKNPVFDVYSILTFSTGGLPSSAPDLASHSAPTASSNVDLHPRVQQRQIEQAAILPACTGARAIVFNLFCLEGWSVAERMRVPCAAVSPFLAPLGGGDMPKGLSTAIGGTIEDAGTWAAIEHWAWRMFLDDVGRYREGIGLCADVICDCNETRTGGFAVPSLMYRLSPAVLAAAGVQLPAGAGVSCVGFFANDDDFAEGKGEEDMESVVCDILQQHSRVIYITFGSMDAMHPALTEAESAATLLQTIAYCLQLADAHAIWQVASPASAIAQTYSSQRATSMSASRLLNRITIVSGTTHRVLLPHGKIFSRCAGVVHHGGAGTFHCALAAGVRQLVVPLMFDQRFWARVGMQLGVARMCEVDGEFAAWRDAVQWLAGGSKGDLDDDDDEEVEDKQLCEEDTEPLARWKGVCQQERQTLTVAAAAGHLARQLGLTLP